MNRHRGEFAAIATSQGRQERDEEPPSNYKNVPIMYKHKKYTGKKMESNTVEQLDIDLLTNLLPEDDEFKKKYQ